MCRKFANAAAISWQFLLGFTASQKCRSNELPVTACLTAQIIAAPSDDLAFSHRNRLFGFWLREKVL
jgi:hypothetical protein